ncbi:MAG: hypothetical protein IT318_00010 [Anaerolineales bacterium]|nr:hypothetical protein [Anaerolineales bacterium]
MTGSVELVLLKCLKCGTPVPAEEDEVAWTCATCGQGLQLVEDGLVTLEVRWAAAPPGQRPDRWLPLWVMHGTVRFLRRETYSGRGEPHELWQQPASFFVSAFPCSLQQLERLGADLTQQQPQLQPGPAAGPLRGCTLLPQDARAAAEFVVLTIEAERKDKLKYVDFDLLLSRSPELWVLPFAGDRPLVG